MGRKPNKKPVGGKKSDRHKPGRYIRLPVSLANQLEGLAGDNVTNLTQEAIRAIREYLERHNRWPLPKPSAD